MNGRRRKFLLDLADVLTAYFPRLACAGYYIFFAFAWVYVVDWFMHFDWTTVTEPSVALAVAGFPTAILAVLTNMIRDLTKMAGKDIGEIQK